MATFFTPVAASSTPNTTSSSSSSSSVSSASAQQAKVTEKQFLQLLVAQLKNQDPLSPMDGTQFVTQLAQFSELEQMIGVNQGVQQLVTDTQGASGAGSNANATGSSSNSGGKTNSSQGTQS